MASPCVQNSHFTIPDIKMITDSADCAYICKLSCVFCKLQITEVSACVSVVHIEQMVNISLLFDYYKYHLYLSTCLYFQIIDFMFTVYRTYCDIIPYIFLSLFSYDITHRWKFVNSVGRRRQN